MIGQNLQGGALLAAELPATDAELIRNDIARFAGVIKSANIKLEN